MARDHIICRCCDEKLIYDGDEKIRGYIEVRWGDTDTDGWTHEAFCPKCSGDGSIRIKVKYPNGVMTDTMREIVKGIDFSGLMKKNGDEREKLDALIRALWAAYREMYDVSDVRGWPNEDLDVWALITQHSAIQQPSMVGTWLERADKAEVELARLRSALTEVDATLRNDLYTKRVRNALAIIQDALAG